MVTVEGRLVGYIVVERGHAGAPGRVYGIEWAAREDAETEAAACQLHADGKGTGARYSTGAIVELTAPTEPQDEADEIRSLRARLELSERAVDRLSRRGGEG